MRAILPLLLSLLIATPATAHSLRLFARVEGNAVGGYAFFIGGGRPAGVKWVASMGEVMIASGETDAQGRYRFTVPDPVLDMIAVTVDTGEGHVATAKLPLARFGLVAGAVEVASASVPPGDPAVDAAAARMVEAAVERQVGPLMERIEAMDARMRFTDILSGIFLIIGLAGMALWARGRGR